MRIPHTADWYIGQLFHEYDRSYEHQQFLNLLLDRPLNEQINQSFLVSIILLLCSRMKVKSLFIDGGLGSLDPTTLNIAMDALERFHNQGRKVGMISQVHEMTERIPVQIKVRKKQSGRNKVEAVRV